MTRITIDHPLLEELRSASEVIQIVDTGGNLIGTFKPIHVPPYDPELLPDISEEELRQRESEPGGYTTDELLSKLREL